MQRRLRTKRTRQQAVYNQLVVLLNRPLIAGENYA
jgi:hypothetical protein